MKLKLKFILSCIQIPLLYISYYFFKLLLNNSEKNIYHWVIGVDEIASVIYFTKNVLKKSISVSLSKNKFYDLKYDFHINSTNKYIFLLIRIFYGPVLLGYLANKSTHFFYIWNTGFLYNRDFEFKFLKSLNKKIVCLFTGNDIRSIKLSIDYAKKNNLDSKEIYRVDVIENLLNYEKDKKQIAKSADTYADLIFNAKVDQMSYLQSKQYGWTYIYNKEKFFKNNLKLYNKIKILHAPSNPFLKGTPLVRAAIKKLEMEGYKFEYVELQNMPNEAVLKHLRTSQIVLNSFYSFGVGQFGIESMANHCAVLMSADPSIETTLPQDGKDAWMITKYWEVYDNLKYLLDNPEKIKYYADNGYDFAYKHYTYEAAGEYINKVLKENGIID
jgi:hypothetical protein